MDRVVNACPAGRGIVADDGHDDEIADATLSVGIPPSVRRGGRLRFASRFASDSLVLSGFGGRREGTWNEGIGTPNTPISVPTLSTSSKGSVLYRKGDSSARHPHPHRYNVPPSLDHNPPALLSHLIRNLREDTVQYLQSHTNPSQRSLDRLILLSGLDFASVGADGPFRNKTRSW